MPYADTPDRSDAARSRACVPRGCRQPADRLGPACERPSDSTARGSRRHTRRRTDETLDQVMPVTLTGEPRPSRAKVSCSIVSGRTKRSRTTSRGRVRRSRSRLHGRPRCGTRRRSARCPPSHRPVARPAGTESTASRFILPLPQPRIITQVARFVAVPVGRGVEGIRIRAVRDERHLPAHHAADHRGQRGQLVGALRRQQPQVRAKLRRRVAQPHRRDVTGDDEDGRLVGARSGPACGA